MKNPTFSVTFLDKNEEPTNDTDYKVAIIEVGNDTPTHFRVVCDDIEKREIILSVMDKVAMGEFRRISDNKCGQSPEVLFHTIKNDLEIYGMMFNIIQERFDNNP